MFVVGMFLIAFLSTLKTLGVDTGPFVLFMTLVVIAVVSVAIYNSGLKQAAVKHLRAFAKVNGFTHIEKRSRRRAGCVVQRGDIHKCPAYYSGQF